MVGSMDNDNDDGSEHEDRATTPTPPPRSADQRPEMQPAFRRTFSDTPDATLRLAGLARLFRSTSDPRKKGAGRRRLSQPDEDEDEDEESNDGEAAVALERVETGGGVRGGKDDRKRRIRKQDFLMKLGAALQLYGSPVPRTEALLAALAAELNVDGQFYFLQDLLLCSFGADSSCTEMHMVPCPQDDDFDAFRYRKTSHLVRRLLEGGSEESPDDASPAAADVDPHWQRHIRPITLPQAIAKLETIVNSPQLYPKSIIFLAYVSSAASVAIVFWQGNLKDAAVATVSGAFVGLVCVPGSDNFFVAKVQILLSAILTGVVSTLGSTLLERPCSKAIFYAPITILLPGWELSFSLMEFSMSAILLGTARMASALVVGLLLGYGITIGHDVCFSMLSAGTRAAIQDWASSSTCEMQPWYVQLVAFPFVGIPYAIIMHAAPIQWPAMLLVGGGAIALMNGPLSGVQEHLTVFFIAFLIGTAANAHARLTASPALILVVHAMNLLVPDCMAVTSAKSYLDNNLAQGWNTAVSLLLIAISVAAGLLLSQGLAVGVAYCLSAWCRCATKKPMQLRRKRRQRRRKESVIQSGIDSVYF